PSPWNARCTESARPWKEEAMSPRTLAPAAVCLFGAFVGCAHDRAAPAARAPSPPTSAVELTSAAPATAKPAPASRDLNVAPAIARACDLAFDDADRAPKFDFDRSELLPDDRDVLAKIAACVTTGPLRGRALRLVGRADPRGEVEYNMVLGEHRAGSVA